MSDILQENIIEIQRKLTSSITGSTIPNSNCPLNLYDTENKFLGQ
ncbi:MAG: hypothetical protein ACTSYI_12705 [Promethearchaeota archaeon]